MTEETITFLKDLIQYFEGRIERENNPERLEILEDNKKHLEELLKRRQYLVLENQVSNRLLLQCSISVLGELVELKIYENNDDGFITYTFSQSHYLQDENDMNPYRPGSGAVDTTIKGLLFKIDLYKNRFKKIIKKEVNTSF